MEKHNKNLEKNKVERDSLQASLMQIDANYWKLRTKKDYLNVEHNKLQKYIQNMKLILLKQHKELKELKVDIGNVYKSKNELQR